MPRTKYGKRIKTKELVAEIPYYFGKSLVAHNGELDADCCIGYHHISKKMSFDAPHAHEFAEMLCFIGADPKDITDLGAEIEFTLGGEKHLIKTAAVVSIPPNVEHCPIVFKKVDKPLVFMEISLTRNWPKPKGPPPKKAPAKKTARTSKKE
jgi:hypothetical protein